MSNKLSQEKSPYLLQHAENPVNWWPWCHEAFDEARRKQRPVFVSIGYAACHWCHVMAHESFEDRETADFLNENFVSIKVDREEQPDVDLFAMEVCHKLTGSGGWPLSIFMTWDKRPFFAGTYFPKYTVGNMPSFMAVLQEIARIWEGRRNRLLDAADQIINDIKRGLTPLKNPPTLDLDRISSSVFEHLGLAFDSTNGGFGGAPKFPITGFIDFLLALYQKNKEQKALDMASFTLEKMRFGGIWDHVGGGFHRYSVDERWLVPHFEKMLYDQALLIMSYMKGFEATGNGLFLETARETADFCINELLSNKGGFYSALDADSDGMEGAYYVWGLDELLEVLGEKDLSLFRKIFEIEESGNFDMDKNVLALRADLSRLGSTLGLTPSEIKGFIKGATKRLFEARRRRTRPFRDDKIITSWNGLMVCALMELSRKCQKKSSSYMDTARKTLWYLFDSALGSEGLYRRICKDEAKYRACLEDYGALLVASARMYQEEKDEKLLDICLFLTRKILQDFFDDRLNMFVYAPKDDNELPVGLRPPGDGPLPAPVTMLYEASSRLLEVTKDPDVSLLAERSKGQAVFDTMKNPLGNCTFLATCLEKNGR